MVNDESSSAVFIHSSCDKSSFVRSFVPSVAALATCKYNRKSSLLVAVLVALLVEMEVKKGANTSSKNGTASVTGLLLKLIKALAARGVSGNKEVIKSCKRAPQECPMPTTGKAPY